MPTDEITQRVSDRSVRVASMSELLRGPTRYDFTNLKSFIPEEVLKVSSGCGTPVGLKTVSPGETVLDIGSGGGTDCFEASRLVGPSGHVIGVDMADTMLAIARKNAPLVATNLGYTASNVEFRKGTADVLPVKDGAVDLIISNCVINSMPDKRKVFREMFRVVKPGGRFTISDIVADQPVPQYMVHDTEKWGDCLSSALPLTDYISGMMGVGFLGIHLIQSSPWQVIDGIHFISVTLTGHKLPAGAPVSTVRYATLRGPFSRVIDELGTTYLRGIPQPVTSDTVCLLNQPPLASHFVLSSYPLWLDRSDNRWIAIYPTDAPCHWQGYFALLAGPFVEVADDDHHVYRRGEPVEICSKTRTVLEADGYAPHFAIINRAGRNVGDDAGTCAPNEKGCA